jgi:hypothetical protein
MKKNEAIEALSEKAKNWHHGSGANVSRHGSIGGGGGKNGIEASGMAWRNGVIIGGISGD